MAKKKTKDTKGLAGIVNKAPRRVDIRGQDHLLAYITPDEAALLKARGGSGEPGPMGIPQYGYGDNDGSEGYGDGDSDSGPGTDGAGTGDDSDDASDDEMGDVGIMDGPSSPSGPSSSGYDNRARGREKDYGVPEPTSSQIEAARGFGFNTPASRAMEASFALGFNQMGPNRGMGYNVSGREANVALGQIADRMAMAKAGYNLPGPLSTLGKIAGVVAQANLSRIQENIQAGYPAAFDKMGQVQGAWGPGPVSGTMAYSGNPVEGNPGTGWVDDTKGEQDSNIRRDFGRTQIGSSVEVSATPTSPPSYYGQGVGTATTNLYDPTKIDPYLASLYGITPSPIGASYDETDSSYSMPNSRKDAKSRTRLRGLDIFKPVSIVS